MSTIESIKELIPVVIYFICALGILILWMIILLWRDLKEEQKGNAAKDGGGDGGKEEKGGDDLDRIHF